MANHTLYIIFTRRGNICKVASFAYKTNYFLCTFSNTELFVVIRNILYSNESVSNGNVGKQSISVAVGRGRMLEVESHIGTYANNKNTFAKFRDTIFGKVIKMRYYNISWGNVLKVFDDLANGFLLVRGENAFYVFSDKCLGL